MPYSPSTSQGVGAALLVLSLLAGCARGARPGEPGYGLPRSSPVATSPAPPVIPEKQRPFSGGQVFLPLISKGFPPASPDYPPDSQDWAATELAGMSLERKVGQLMIVDLPGDLTQDPDCSLLAELHPGGISMATENVIDPQQTRALAAGLQGCAQAGGDLPLLVALDHEGEYVLRFDRGATIFPSALALGATGDARTAFEMARLSGSELAYSGVNLVLGPVADVLLDLDNQVVGQRTYGSDPRQVAQFVSQAVQGYLEAGLIPALKHFPGHGGVSGDSHRELPVDEVPLARLKEAYLPPFTAGLQAGAPVVMLSHVAYPKVTGDKQVPATLSPRIVGLLRDDLGFDSVIMSDALDMKALVRKGTSLPEAALLAVQAGVDLLLVTSPEHARAVRKTLLAAAQSGELPAARLDEAVERILRLKAAYHLAAFPLPSAPEPDWQADQEAARVMGAAAVSVLKDNAGLVPLPSELRHILVVGPDETWDFYPVLKSALEQAGFSPQFRYFPPPWYETVQDSPAINGFNAAAGRADLVLVFTWQARLNRLVSEDAGQMEVVRGLLKAGPPVVAVGLKSPTDLLDFPSVPAFIATYGTNSGALEGLLNLLLGREPATLRSSPLTDLP